MVNKKYTEHNFKNSTVRYSKSESGKSDIICKRLSRKRPPLVRRTKSANELHNLCYLPSLFLKQAKVYILVAPTLRSKVIHLSYDFFDPIIDLDARAPSLLVDWPSKSLFQSEDPIICYQL